jgi:hypothetical protein
MEARELQYMKTAAFLGISCVVALALIPIFTQKHQPARAVSCMSNVKVIGTGMMMYLEDYDEQFPRATDWMDATYPYLKNKNTYRCPQSGSTQSNDFGYAFNATLAFKTLVTPKAPAHRNATTAAKDNALTTPPAILIMLYDSRDLRWNASTPGLSGVADPPRHGMLTTIGYADGHAKQIPLNP